MESPSGSIEEKDRATSDEKDEREYIEKSDPDDAFGGFAERKRLERKLLWKLDCRMFIMVIIYILNHVRARATRLLDASN